MSTRSQTKNTSEDEYKPDVDNGVGQDDDYSMRQGQDRSAVPVVKDEGESGVNPDTEDSDETLARDDKDAIDESNIIDERTRGAEPEGSYAEGEDENEFKE